MISLAEATQSYLETITYQMCNMSHAEQSKHMGGHIALFKMFVTRSAHEISDDADFHKELVYSTPITPLNDTNSHIEGKTSSKTSL